MKTTLHKIVFALIVGALFVPLFRPSFHVLPPLSLSPEGQYKKPRFSFADYFSSAYQDSFNLFIDHNFDYRPFFIKSCNEINYHLFKLNPSDVIIGKEGYLFAPTTVANYTGETFPGLGIIKNNVRLLKKVQDSLKNHNIDLLVLYAPGKATFYSEFLPDKYIARKKDSTAYAQYSAEFKNQQINFIDLNAYFLSIKNKSKYLLYPKQGAHWSYYGLALSVDTITKFIESRRNIKMSFTYTDVVLKSDLTFPDYDLGEILNVLNTLPHDPMPYPKYSDDAAKSYKPDVLVIGDSYWLNSIWAGIPKRLFKQDVFWYYFNEEFINDKPQKILVADINLKEKLLGRDVIIIESSEANYEDFFFHFAENVNFMFCPSTNNRVNELQKEILKNNTWLEEVRKKAVGFKLPLDSMIYLDAKYVADQESKK